MRMDALAASGVTGNVVEFPVDAVAAEPHKIREYVSPGCVFVLDEVWRIFPQGLQANKVPEEYKSLLAEHRHMVDAAGNSTQIVFVVQDLANIGAFARRLVETTFVTTKLGHVGLSNSYRVDIFHGAVTGATPPVGNRLRFITGMYRKEIFALYKSQTMSEATSHGSEAKIDKRANIWKRPIVIVGAIAIPFMLFGGVHFMGKATEDMIHGGVVHLGSGPNAERERSEPAAFGVATVVGNAKNAPSSPRLLMMVQGVRVGELFGVLQFGASTVWVEGSSCRSELVYRFVRYACEKDGVWYDTQGELKRALFSAERWH
jgi:zona occludens toxin (predicted ATPase)